ncbi:hypothetical protein [Streptomyces apocyni]|uniref:hypothetical protein n=1 Tax=Streptomyces apocyni TaxID=2654677 RepID=UPI0012EA2D70|nr:hypothetical protein [Streptomyces apocyni]
MTVGIIHALLCWVAAVFRPRPCGTVPAPGTAPLHPAPEPLALPRSPYGLDLPIDGTETALVRPYLVADERRQRRLALVLAADFGIDLDTHVLNGAGVA